MTHLLGLAELVLRFEDEPKVAAAVHEIGVELIADVARHPGEGALRIRDLDDGRSVGVSLGADGLWVACLNDGRGLVRSVRVLP